MSMIETKKILQNLILNEEAKVISLTGAWGSGKTHLWNEVRKNSQDEKIKKAKYISLYGLENIKSVKESLLRNIIGHDKDGRNIKRNISKTVSYLNNVATQFYKCAPAVLDFSDIALPFYLKESFVVIDDIERLDKNLNVKQIMGLINEYISQYGTRFLLIMNKTEFSTDTLSCWQEMNEKMIDYEISHTLTPAEAFEIAAKGHQISYHEEIKKAVVYFNVGNIRVINKILNLVSVATQKFSSLREGALSRIIPCIVLTGFVYYKVIDVWNDTDDYLKFMDEHPFRLNLSVRRNDNIKAIELLKGIGLISVNGYASEVIKVIESSLTNIKRLHELTDEIARSEAELLAENHYISFLNLLYWDFKKDNEATIKSEARELLSDVKYLTPRNISILLDFFEGDEDLKALSREFFNEWVKHRGNKSLSVKESDTAEISGVSIRQDILAELNILKESDSIPRSVKETLNQIYLNKAWGERNKAVLRESTVEGLISEIYDLSPHELNAFLRHMLFISETGMINDLIFKETADKFETAAHRIISENKYPKLSVILRDRLNLIESEAAQSDGKKVP